MKAKEYEQKLLQELARRYECWYWGAKSAISNSEYYKPFYEGKIKEIEGIIEFAMTQYCRTGKYYYCFHIVKDDDILRIYKEIKDDDLAYHKHNFKRWDRFKREWIREKNKLLVTRNLNKRR